MVVVGWGGVGCLFSSLREMEEGGRVKKIK